MRKWLRTLHRYTSVNGIYNAIRFRNIRIASDVRLRISGSFDYGPDCAVNSGSNIIVPHGSALSLGRACYLGRHVELGPTRLIEIGDETSVQDRSILLGDVSVGRYCSLAPNVFISSGRHHFDIEPYQLIKDQDRAVAVDENLAKRENKPVVVEDDCWIGINAVINPGAYIGKGAVIGANSVVSGRVEPYSVVAGAPAKELRKRLKFVPPAKLDYRDPESAPYFYSGFHVSRAAISKNASLGGIVAERAFAICIAAAKCKVLYVTARSLKHTSASLTMCAQTKAVSDHFSELSFEVPQGWGGTKFEFLGAPSGAQFVISRIWAD